MKKCSMVFALTIFLCVMLVGCKKIVVTDCAFPPKSISTEFVTKAAITTKATTAPLYVDLGEFMLTAYCPCRECSDEYGDMTATGVRAKAKHTIAVDTDVIPYGSEVVVTVDGETRTYKAEDCGAKVNGKHIDIYFESHKEAESFGVQYADVLLNIGKGK